MALTVVSHIANIQKQPDCTPRASPKSRHMASTISASSQQANKAALNAALAENPERTPATNIKANENDVEPGEIQEVDMQAQAEGIRTVFNDPTNFNVKVGSAVPLCMQNPLIVCATSILFTLRGPSGSIHQLQKAGIFPTPLVLLSPTPRFLRPQVQLQRRDGWRTSNA